MLLCLVCPNCLDAFERETREYAAAHPCPGCGALLLMSYHYQPHLVIQCRECRHVYEGVEGQPAAGLRPICPKCGEPAGTAGDETGSIDFGPPAELKPYRPVD